MSVYKKAERALEKWAGDNQERYEYKGDAFKAGYRAGYLAALETKLVSGVQKAVDDAKDKK